MFVFVEPDVQNDANNFAKYDRSHEALSSVLHQRRLAVTNFVLLFRLITVVCIFHTLTCPLLQLPVSNVDSSFQKALDFL